MLGTAHILMIRHGFYRSLPHREGGRGRGNVTDPKQELRSQFRFVRRNPALIATLYLLHTGLLQIDNAEDFAALRQLHRIQARLRRKHLAALAQEMHGPASASVILSEANDLHLQPCHPERSEGPAV